MKEPEVLKPHVVALAASLFTRLVGDNAKATEKGITLAVDPKGLAQLSFKLAAVFTAVEGEINADALPKNVGYKLDGADISSWTK